MWKSWNAPIVKKWYLQDSPGDWSAMRQQSSQCLMLACADSQSLALTYHCLLISIVVFRWTSVAASFWCSFMLRLHDLLWTSVLLFTTLEQFAFSISFWPSVSVSSTNSLFAAASAAAARPMKMSDGALRISVSEHSDSTVFCRLLLRVATFSLPLKCERKNAFFCGESGFCWKHFKNCLQLKVLLRIKFSKVEIRAKICNDSLLVSIKGLNN